MVEEGSPVRMDKQDSWLSTLSWRFMSGLGGYLEQLVSSSSVAPRPLAPPTPPKPPMPPTPPNPSCSESMWTAVRSGSSSELKSGSLGPELSPKSRESYVSEVSVWVTFVMRVQAESVDVLMVVSGIEADEVPITTSLGTPPAVVMLCMGPPTEL